ncbi:MAG: NAD(P)-binding domain-containing protein [Bacteroidaceae bacterium]|nr:NAD(P)-binding domain-containing protein [Bacteroidaceae bacterium]
MKLTILTDIGLKLDLPEWKEILSEFDVDIYHDTTPDLVVERSEGAEILLTNKVVITPEHLKQLPEVKYIIMASTGTNVVDLNYCHANNIWCSNVPAYSTNSVAQLVFSHILNIYTRAEHYSQKNRKGAWSSTTDFCYADSPIYELTDKTIGIVGLGAIGQRVAKIAMAFGMNVVALSSKATLPDSLLAVADNTAGSIRVAKDKDDFYSSCDIITLHCPLSENNAKMINAASIEKMKEGVIIVNTARGGLIDEADMRKALDSGKVGAFAADVISVEPAQKDNPIMDHPNAFITPHNAWMSEEALYRLNITIINNIKTYLKTGEPINKV